jgi:hypothetical protein
MGVNPYEFAWASNFHYNITGVELIKSLIGLFIAIILF